jgi:hypothetical protein
LERKWVSEASKPFIVIILEQRETENINRMITLSKLPFPMSKAIFI